MTRDRRAGYKAYREANKERIKAYLAEWRAKNPTYGKNWYENNKHRQDGYNAVRRAKYAAARQARRCAPS